MVPTSSSLYQSLKEAKKKRRKEKGSWLEWHWKEEHPCTETHLVETTTFQKENEEQKKDGVSVSWL